ncbi:MAG: PLP-dependent aminotransferase family protein [Planctomycetaceae bacterium]|nr:PLP-dependent aminotransferase family protein [Planctomycetaceae bacterium]
MTAVTSPIKFSQRWHFAREQAISFLMQQAVENTGVVSLAAGLVDFATLPVPETQAAISQMLGDDAAARQALQYGTTAGSERLRRLLLAHLARLEGTTVEQLGIDAGQLILTTGSQQMLSLVCEVLLDPGDICLVAGPTYFVFLGNLNGVGAEAVTVDTDDGGMRPDALEAALEALAAAGRLDRVKLIYLVSYYENPSGVCLAEERRASIVEIAQRWSKRHRILILEDAAYRELHYDGPVLPSVWGCDASRDTVIYTQTFSKSFSPGLRVGYGVVPRDLVGPLCDRKGNEDFGSANFNQHLLATVLESEMYAAHVEQVCAAYRIKRDAMLSAANRYFSDISGVSWVHPHGGLYVWMSLPSRIETGFQSELFRRATQAHRVMYVPGELCYGHSPTERPRHQMRLSFGVQSPAGIDDGMHRLSRAVRDVV